LSKEGDSGVYSAVRNRTHEIGSGAGRLLLLEVSWDITMERRGAASSPPASVDGKATIETALTRYDANDIGGAIDGSHRRISTTTVDAPYRGGSASGTMDVFLEPGHYLRWFIYFRYSGSSVDEYKTLADHCSIRVKEKDSYPPPSTM